MWPRSEERGNYSEPLRFRADRELQCGRAPRSAEIICLRASTLRSASMWPRSEERGNLVRPPSSSARSTLQCGRAPRSAEINQPLGSNTTSIFGFNVAALRGARKYSILYRPRARSFLRGFNVAALRGARKFGAVGSSAPGLKLLQCGRAPRSTGVRPPYPAGCRRSPGFNVAALRGARKSADGRRLAEPGELRFNVAALRGARKCRQERRTR